MKVFKLGHLVATPAALEALVEAHQSSREFLARHQRGEQGALSEADHQSNALARETGERVFSAFTLKTGVRIWVITEAEGENGHRYSTCLLLPEDY